MQRKKPPKHYARAQADYQCMDPISMRPIGVVESPYLERFAAPRQPALAQPLPARIHLHSDHNFEKALTDLTGFSHIWVIYWMHLNQGWNPIVTPPRGPKVRRGLFATRAPHRPNPIGLSAVRLVRIEGLILHIEGLDMLDGTPVLDIKPYLPFADAVGEATSGWLEEAGLS